MLICNLLSNKSLILYLHYNNFVVMAKKVDPNISVVARKTLAEKVAVLDILRNNNFNYESTSSETGVPSTTLRFWQSKLGPAIREAVEGDVAMAEVVVDTLTKMETAQNRFMEKATLVKKRALDKIDKMIEKEKSMKNLIETVKILHLITNPEVNTSQLSPYEEVFTKFLIEGPKSLPNGKKSNQSTDPGDSEE